MPLARIVASNPAAARETALALRQAGYEVNIVPPGTPSDPNCDLEFDADHDTVISQKIEEYVPGEREFVLKPLWRKLTAKYRANRDVARAQQSISGADVSSRTAAPAAPERYDERAAQEATFAAAEKRRLEREQARKEEELTLRRVREERESARRAEELRLQQLQAERETARQRELEAQRAENQRVEELRRKEEAARHREYEQQQLVLRQQEQERARAEAARRAEQAEAARMQQVARERDERQRQGEAHRRAEEEHRLLVMRQRETEERERRAHAQQMLLQANRQREESRAREIENEREGPKGASSVPTVGQYLVMRKKEWQETRARRSAEKRANITVIDRSSAFAWRQAWPITAGVAAAFLLGWGVAAYHESTPAKTVTSQPPVLSPGQYAPYPIAQQAPTKKASVTTTQPKRRAVHDTSIAQDEVITHHYYPSKATTAQNRSPRRKISDLQ